MEKLNQILQNYSFLSCENFLLVSVNVLSVGSNWTTVRAKKATAPGCQTLSASKSQRFTVHQSHLAI